MAGRVSPKAPGAGNNLGHATKYTVPELVSLWIRNGGSKTASGIAGAVAFAESGGEPNATHLNSDGSTDYGLWQINSVHGVGTEALDPDKNAQLAIQISNNGKDWSPWTTFKSGAYKKYLAAGQDAQSGATDPTIGSQISSAANSLVSPFTDIAKAISFIFSYQFLQVVAGGLIMMMALWMIYKSTTR